MRTWIREQSLSLFFFTIFLAAVIGQSIAGHAVFNQEQLAHGSEPVSYLRYIVSSHFGEAMLENWESEWLQLFLFALAGVWLVQKGSPESKELDQAGLESDEQQKIRSGAERTSPAWARVGGLRTVLYENSLLLAFGTIFLGSWFAQSATGWTEYNNRQEEHGDPTVSWATYVTRPDFWEKTLQNWQSEFLAVGTMAVFAIYLRQRGSPESKPVGAAHDATGQTG